MKLHKQRLSLSINWPQYKSYAQRLLKILIPSPGNIVFTVLTVSVLLWAQGAGALPFSRAPLAASSTSTIAYQGRLAAPNGTPINTSVPMVFRLYNAASGSTALWTETWSAANSVQVQQGLFNVMLGSLNGLPQSVIASNTSLWLGISIGSDAEMTPRAQLGSVPYATQALTVPDASITTAKLANSSVTSSKLSNGSVDQTKAPSLVRSLNGDSLKIQTGIFSSSVNGAQFESFPINFNVPFTQTPIVTLSNCTDGNEDRWGEVIWTVGEEPTSNGFVAHYHLPAVVTGTYKLCWIAIGQ